METLTRDVRLAVRMLRKSPGFTAVAVLSLGLGIGANTAVFWIVDCLLLTPLPVDSPNRLVLVGSPDERDVTLTHPVWEEIRSRRLLKEAYAWGADRVDLAESGESVFADAIWASGDFFEVLGVPAIAGRTFDGRDDKRGGGEDGPVAVISYEFWRQNFGGDTGAIGQELTIERVPFTIVGVTPPGFFGPEVGANFDVALPLETESLIGRSPGRLDNRFWPWLRVMARLEPGATVEEVSGKLQAAQAGIREATMPGYSRVEDRDAYLGQPLVARAAPGGSSQLRARYVPALLVLLGLVGLILLVACTNLANLLLARLKARRYELTMRLALGASQLRLLRQLLAESLLLSAIGGALGLVLAYWGSRALVRQLSTWAHSIRHVSEQLNVFYVRERLLAILSGFLGLLAVFLAALGLYGVATHAVVSRRTEIAVRIALGARPSAVVRLIVRRVVALAGLGILVGGAASYWAARFVRSLLFGVPPKDAQTFFLAAVVLGAVAAAAGFLAARRATRIDPVTVLREG